MTAGPGSVLRRAGGWALPAGAGCLLVMAVLFLIHQFVCNQTEPGGCFHSDSLYVAAIARNLLGATWSMNGSHLPGAPYVFPDVVLMLPCVAVTSNLAVSYLLYALLFYPLLALAVAAVARQTGLPWREAVGLGAGGVAALLAAHVGAEAYRGRAMELSYAGNHVGALCTGLFLAALALHWLRRPVGLPSAALFILMGGFAAFSDKLLLPQFLMPLGLSFAALGCLRIVRVRMVAAVAACIAGAAVAGLVTKALFERLGFVPLSVESDLSVTRGLASWGPFLKQLPGALAGQYAVIVLAPAAAVLALVVLARWARPAGAEDLECRGLEAWPPGTAMAAPAGAGNRAAVLAVALLLLLSVLCNAVVLVGLGQYRGPENLRYLLPFFYLPFLFAGLLARLVPRRHPAWARAGVAVLTAGFVLFHLGGQAPGFAFAHFRQPYPEVARALDGLARERGARFGFAGFWYARHEGFLTHEGVRVKAISAMGAPYLHSDNASDYLSADPADLSLPRYQFVLFDDMQELDRQQIALEYGQPRERRKAGTCEIWLYDELSSSRLQRFLTGLLAGKVRRRLPYEGPARPAALARPKANYSPWNAAGNAVLRDGQSLEAVFAHPMTGAMIDLAADWATEYEVTFYRGAERVGGLRVPSVPWSGATYQVPSRPVVFARLLRLPPALRTQEWDRAVIRPTTDGERHAVAHLLVYHDAVDLPPPCTRRFTHRRFEAETMYTLLDPKASVIADAAASGGRARRAPAGSPSVLAYWPGLALEPGRYRADYAVRLERPVPPEHRVGRLVVTSDSTPRPLGYRDLYGKDFRGDDGYQVLSLEFHIAREVNDLAFRIDTCGAAPLAVDYVDLTALPADAGGGDQAAEEK